MKKILSVMLAMLFVFTLCSCSDKNKTETGAATGAVTKNINDERIIGSWGSVYSGMSSAFYLDFYDGGIGKASVKAGGEFSYYYFEWYSCGDNVMVYDGSEYQLYCYKMSEGDAEYHLFLENGRDELMPR